jgi:hypothetical protein
VVTLPLARPSLLSVSTRLTAIFSDDNVLLFDAILSHTYEVLEACEILILHLRKNNRF